MVRYSLLLDLKKRNMHKNDNTLIAEPNTLRYSECLSCTSPTGTPNTSMRFTKCLILFICVVLIRAMFFWFFCGDFSKPKKRRKRKKSRLIYCSVLWVRVKCFLFYIFWVVSNGREREIEMRKHFIYLWELNQIYFL